MFLIRTQDRTCILPLELNQVVIPEPGLDGYVNIWYGQPKSGKNLGKYSSQNAALKVLDELVEEYQYAEYCKCGNILEKIPKFIYEMPKFEDVKDDNFNTETTNKVNISYDFY